MTETVRHVELAATGFQVELMGSAGPQGRRLTVNGADFSQIARAVTVRVPANGHVEVDVELIPYTLLSRTDVDDEHFRLWFDGWQGLIDAADDAAAALPRRETRKRLEEAVRIVRFPWGPRG